MGEKNPRDMISKASWTLMEGMKDATSANITMALRTNQLDIKADQITKLMTLINASIEEGYHRGFAGFTRTVNAATVSVPEPVPEVKAKKKSTSANES